MHQISHYGGEQGSKQKQAEVNDHRITRLGHFLRNSSIDEIPQIYQCSFGHMSVVGPRPHMHSDCLRFARIVPDINSEVL